MATPTNLNIYEALKATAYVVPNSDIEIPEIAANTNIANTNPTVLVLWKKCKSRTKDSGMITLKEIKMLTNFGKSAKARSHIY
jgi:hypothetical protein